MSVEDFQSLAKMVLLVLASGIGGMTTLGFVVALFFVIETN